MGGGGAGVAVRVLRAQGDSGHGDEVVERPRGEGGVVGPQPRGGADEGRLGLQFSEETDDEGHPGDLAEGD